VTNRYFAVMIVFDSDRVTLSPEEASIYFVARAGDGASLGTYTVGGEPWGVCFDGANTWVTMVASNQVSKL
jgi:hypothetical protein